MMLHAGPAKQQHRVKPCANAGRSRQVGMATEAGNVVSFRESAREAQKSIKCLESELKNKYSCWLNFLKVSG